MPGHPGGGAGHPHSAFPSVVSGGGLTLEDCVDAFNLEVQGLRQQTEVWAHTCWGNPYAQRLTANSSYKPALPYLDRLNVDVITFEGTENNG